MSLFDGTPERPKSRSPKKASGRATQLPKRKARSAGHGENSPVKQKVSGDERARITAAYERGELKFDDVSQEFLLCRCSMPPDYRSLPHPPHVDEIATFELQHYGKRKV